MAKQPAISALQKLGRLPCSADADASQIQEYQTYLEQVQGPVSDDEACALVHLLGPDDCFGLAWTIVHIVETAPNWPTLECLDDIPSDWTAILKQRAGI